MNLKVKIHLSTEIIEQNIEYPTQNKISFTIDPRDQTVKVNKITLNDIETNIFYNTSFLINDSDTVLTSVHEITKKGVYTLQLDDLYILSHRSNNWHCSELKEDHIFQYEFTRDSFTNIYRDRDHKGFKDEFIPCFGCSFTYGAYQPDTNTWPYLLSQKTGRNYLNMGVGGSGIDGIYHNLKLLHKQHNFNQCVILFPNFERRVVRCKIDGMYIGMHSTVDLSSATSEYHFYRNKDLVAKMQKVRDRILGDTENRYSKFFLNKIINYCNDNNIKLSASGWDDEVYDYLQTKDSIELINKFPKLSLFKERADDGGHPHKNHYQYFTDSF
mgnify:FL=1|tara:strand:+ start:76 stop:1059 length:984 start_codon:yes stop_codon:yes gene_type:complete